MPKNEYKIMTQDKGILVLFKTDFDDSGDMNSDIELSFEQMYSDSLNHWFVSRIECHNPNIPVVNRLLLQITEKLEVEDPENVRELVNLCDSLADFNDQIFSYKV